MLAVGGFWGCAVGTSATNSDGGLTTDGGGGKDTGPKTDSGQPSYDSGQPGYDSGNPPPPVDSGGGCGTCLGSASTCCGTTCVDTTTDPNNCGFCGNGCTGLTCCSSACVDTTSDNSNCGNCNNVCGGGTTCQSSQCVGGSSSCTISLGTCAHSPCTTGVALALDCDSSDEDLTFWVCIFDGLTSCCTSTWDSSCVADAAGWEANSCIGSGC